jgi:transcriptional regulator with GAF, ATPase, and Fis domain
VLQDKEIERVGGTKTIQLDIRIIAATNRNLEEMVKANQFREDLWFRINVFPIRIPPLRERKFDIQALLQHFISLKTKELKLPSVPAIAPGAIEALMQYDWPGNVRELENVVERALILSVGKPLDFSHMKAQILNVDSGNIGRSKKTDNLNDIVSQHIQNVLAKTGGTIHGPEGAAELLGINPSTLRNKMNKLGIPYGRKLKRKDIPTKD